MKNIFKAHTAQLFVIIFLSSIAACNDLPNVTDVTVAPDAVTVFKGENVTFTATVTGNNDPTQTVTWSIVETEKNIGTTIDENGKLTVAFAESLVTLTVKATSTVDNSKSGTATVLVTDVVNPPEHFNDITATQLVNEIRIGWNLGNTLDCAHLTWLGANPTIAQLETAWGNPVTTKANIDALKNAGFNAIRIPVSWTKCADANYIIRTDWMTRVKDVVDYAVDNDMYILLNTHHDEDIFKFLNKDMDESLKAFKKIWEQIADAFKNYNEKLVFEALNEPRTQGSQNEWNGGTTEERNNLNTYYRLFVETVRASGGNNDKRILMINTYGASTEPNAINDLEIPADNANSKIIVSVHIYAPYYFVLSTNNTYNTWDKNKMTDTNPITEPIDRAYNAFVCKGIPVIIGEFGAMNKNNIDARAEWAEFFVYYANSKGIPCFWWDNGAVSGDGERFGLLDRRTNTFTYPTIVEALIKGTDPNAPPPPPPPPPVITLGANSPWGWQSFYESSAWYGDKIEQGDIFTFTYSFKSNATMDYLQLFLVDNSVTVNWWLELSARLDIQRNIEANTEYSGAMTFTATRSASGTTSAANRLTFSSGTGTINQPTLTFTTFSLVKE